MGVTALRNFGLKRFKRREVVFINKVWENHAHAFHKALDSDVKLIRMLAEKVDEEDTKQALENGDLIKPPAKLNVQNFKVVHSGVDLLDETEEEPNLDEDVLHNIRDVLLSSPHSWIGSSVMAFNQQNKTRRIKGKYYFQDLKGYLESMRVLCNIQTEKKFLLLLFILIKLSNRSRLSESDLELGPDVMGWRSFFCQDYAEVEEYHFPKKSNVYSR